MFRFAEIWAGRKLKQHFLRSADIASGTASVRHTQMLSYNNYIYAYLIFSSQYQFFLSFNDSIITEKSKNVYHVELDYYYCRLQL